MKRMQGISTRIEEQVIGIHLATVGLSKSYQHPTSTCGVYNVGMSDCILCKNTLSKIKRSLPHIHDHCLNELWSELINLKQDVKCRYFRKVSDEDIRYGKV